MGKGVIERKRPKGRKQAAIVFILPCLLFGLAWFMYFSGYLVPEGRTNKGELILPPPHFDDFALYEQGKDTSFDQQNDLWTIVVFGSNHCSDDICRDVLYKTRQVHIGLGREADRVRRIYIAEDNPVINKSLKEDHPGIFWLKGDPSIINRVLSIKKWPENNYYIVDPLGNIMMRYRPNQKGGDLLRDMQKLLKASNIG
ncbi:MAG: hypothetical protein PUP46_02145 [Endozoicomonas sp. (ex Botrylloides leachii)]|nr:hypothetical protein [Endozoicomonas sp. (ex Botrylloides leachii)]